MKTKEFVVELRSMKVEELVEKRASIAEELLKGRFKAAVGQSVPGLSMAHIRRSLARVETELSRRRG